MAEADNEYGMRGIGVLSCARNWRELAEYSSLLLNDISSSRGEEIAARLAPLEERLSRGPQGREAQEIYAQMTEVLSELEKLYQP